MLPFIGSTCQYLQLQVAAIQVTRHSVKIMYFDDSFNLTNFYGVVSVMGDTNHTSYMQLDDAMQGHTLVIPGLGSGGRVNIICAVHEYSLNDTLQLLTSGQTGQIDYCLRIIADYSLDVYGAAPLGYYAFDSRILALLICLCVLGALVVLMMLFQCKDDSANKSKDAEKSNYDKGMNELRKVLSTSPINKEPPLTTDNNPVEAQINKAFTMQEE